MTAQRIAAVLSDRRGEDCSDFDSGAAPSQIAARAEDELRNRMRTAPDAERQAWASLSVIDIVRRLGLLTMARTLTHAEEVLLVGRPGSEIHYSHRRTRSGQLTTNERLVGPALVAVTRALELVETRTERTPVHLPNGQQLFVADLPDIAVREAIVNAVMHRDYQVAGPVQIEHI